MSKRRSRGEGSIYFLEKKGLWVAKVTLPDGSRKVKYSKTQKVVREWLVASQNAIRQGSFVKDDGLILSEYLTRYMNDIGKAFSLPRFWSVLAA